MRFYFKTKVGERMLFSRNASLLDACVLGALDGGDTYGYELTARIGAAQDVSDSALYPVLKRLQRENLLSTYDEAVNGRNRRYYSITDEGRAKLASYRGEWEEFKRTVDAAMRGRAQSPPA